MHRYYVMRFGNVRAAALKHNPYVSSVFSFFRRRRGKVSPGSREGAENLLPRNTRYCFRIVREIAPIWKLMSIFVVRIRKCLTKRNRKWGGVNATRARKWGIIWFNAGGSAAAFEITRWNPSGFFRKTCLPRKAFCYKECRCIIGTTVNGFSGWL